MNSLHVLYAKRLDGRVVAPVDSDALRPVRPSALPRASPRGAPPATTAPPVSATGSSEPSSAAAALGGDQGAGSKRRDAITENTLKLMAACARSFPGGLHASVVLPVKRKFSRPQQKERDQELVIDTGERNAMHSAFSTPTPMMVRVPKRLIRPVKTRCEHADHMPLQHQRRIAKETAHLHGQRWAAISRFIITTQCRADGGNQTAAGA
jgi:hypothetical protein